MSGRKQVVWIALVVVFRMDDGRGASVVLWRFWARTRSRSASWWAGEGLFVSWFSDAGSRAAADRKRAKRAKREKKRLVGNMFLRRLGRNIG